MGVYEYVYEYEGMAIRFFSPLLSSERHNCRRTEEFLTLFVYPKERVSTKYNHTTGVGRKNH